MADYKNLAKEARIKVLSMIHKAGTSHIASNFSVIDIATVLYENLKENDEVVWSKGWAAASIYYFLAQRGEISFKALDLFPNPPYLGLAETTVNGVHVNGGSVGHGLGVSVGMAYAKKLKGEGGTVYCIMSDGELNEGSVWEAVMFAAHHKLDNLVGIIDSNAWQAMGRTEDVISLDNPTLRLPIGQREPGPNLGWKFESFNWNAYRTNGHDHKTLSVYLTAIPKGKPSILICDTVKGKGVSFFEDHLLYHYKHVDDADYEKALAELQNA